MAHSPNVPRFVNMWESPTLTHNFAFSEPAPTDNRDWSYTLHKVRPLDNLIRI